MEIFWFGFFVLAAIAMTAMGYCIVRAGDDDREDFFGDYIQELED